MTLTRRPRRSPPASALVALVALVAAGALASGCGGSSGDGTAGDGRLRVVTTVAPLTSIVANVAGPGVEVTGLVPEGSNSHTFEPPPSAARALARADVVFVNGLGLEEPTVELAEANLGGDAEIVSLGDEVLPEDEWIYDFSFPEEGGKPNPHTWTDPGLAASYATVVRDALVRLDPDHAAAYRANHRRFVARTEALSDAITDASASIPHDERKLLTYHDAYAYFAAHYGWTVVGAIQPSDFSEPSARDVADLIRQIRAERVPALFGSEVFPSPVLEQISAETGATYVDDLRDDDLPGQPGDADHSWLGLLRFDYVTVVEAFGGDASALRALDVSDVARDAATYPQ